MEKSTQGFLGGSGMISTTTGMTGDSARIEKDCLN